MGKLRSDWPPWRDWELELWDHAEERMEDRPFSEVDLRRMIEKAAGYKKARREGRWILESRHLNRRWEIIVKPDHDAEILEVITAYPVERKTK